ncbi:MAG: hypothetical protein ACP5FK_11155 [bacterium]
MKKRRISKLDQILKKIDLDELNYRSFISDQSITIYDTGIDIEFR